MNDWTHDGILAGRPLFNWDAARRMARNGMTFGAHTRSHPNLTALPPEQVRAEVAGSKKELELALATPIPVFAYPYGEHDTVSRSAVEESGFQAACTVRPGVNTPSTGRYLLRRTEIHGCDSVPLFAMSLWLGVSVAQQLQDRSASIRRLVIRGLRKVARLATV